MMPYVRDVLMTYENALLMFNSENEKKETKKKKNRNGEEGIGGIERGRRTLAMGCGERSDWGIRVFVWVEKGRQLKQKGNEMKWGKGEWTKENEW